MPLTSLYSNCACDDPDYRFLTAVMIMIAFGAAGFWLEGAIAGAGGALSLAYLGRSSAGRIDTDQLNLGLYIWSQGCLSMLPALHHCAWQ